MTGPVTSVLGIRPEQSVEMFLGGLHRAPSTPRAAANARHICSPVTGCPPALRPGTARFHCPAKLLREDRPALTLVDFHAEATSEKLAMGYYLDGQAF